MDDKRAALLLALLALTGAGVRWLLAPRGGAPGDVRLEAARPEARGTLREVAGRAERLARPLAPGERVDVDRADAVELTRPGGLARGARSVWRVRGSGQRARRGPETP